MAKRIRVSNEVKPPRKVTTLGGPSGSVLHKTAGSGESDNATRPVIKTGWVPGKPQFLDAHNAPRKSITILEVETRESLNITAHQATKDDSANVANGAVDHTFFGDSRSSSADFDHPVPLDMDLESVEAGAISVQPAGMSAAGVTTEKLWPASSPSELGGGSIGTNAPSYLFDRGADSDSSKDDSDGHDGSSGSNESGDDDDSQSGDKPDDGDGNPEDIKESCTFPPPGGTNPADIRENARARIKAWSSIQHVMSATEKGTITVETLDDGDGNIVANLMLLVEVSHHYADTYNPPDCCTWWLSKIQVTFQAYWRVRPGKVSFGKLLAAMQSRESEIAAALAASAVRALAAVGGRGPGHVKGQNCAPKSEEAAWTEIIASFTYEDMARLGEEEGDLLSGGSNTGEFGPTCPDPARLESVRVSRTADLPKYLPATIWPAQALSQSALSQKFEQLTEEAKVNRNAYLIRRLNNQVTTQYMFYGFSMPTVEELLSRASIKSSPGGLAMPDQAILHVKPNQDLLDAQEDSKLCLACLLPSESAQCGSISSTSRRGQRHLPEKPPSSARASRVGRATFLPQPLGRGSPFHGSKSRSSGNPSSEPKPKEANIDGFVAFDLRVWMPEKIVSWQGNCCVSAYTGATLSLDVNTYYDPELLAPERCKELRYLALELAKRYFVLDKASNGLFSSTPALEPLKYIHERVETARTIGLNLRGVDRIYCRNATLFGMNGEYQMRGVLAPDEVKELKIYFEDPESGSAPIPSVLVPLTSEVQSSHVDSFVAWQLEVARRVNESLGLPGTNSAKPSGPPITGGGKPPSPVPSPYVGRPIVGALRIKVDLPKDQDPLVKYEIIHEKSSFQNALFFQTVSHAHFVADLPDLDKDSSIAFSGTSRAKGLDDPDKGTPKFVIKGVCRASKLNDRLLHLVPLSSIRKSVQKEVVRHDPMPKVVTNEQSSMWNDEIALRSLQSEALSKMPSTTFSGSVAIKYQICAEEAADGKSCKVHSTSGGKDGVHQSVGVGVDIVFMALQCAEVSLKLGEVVSGESAPIGIIVPTARYANAYRSDARNEPKSGSISGSEVLTSYFIECAKYCDHDMSEKRVGGHVGDKSVKDLMDVATLTFKVVPSTLSLTALRESKTAPPTIKMEDGGLQSALRPIPTGKLADCPPFLHDLWLDVLWRTSREHARHLVSTKLLLDSLDRSIKSQWAGLTIPKPANVKFARGIEVTCDTLPGKNGTEGYRLLFGDTVMGVPEEGFASSDEPLRATVPYDPRSRGTNVSAELLPSAVEEGAWPRGTATDCTPTGTSLEDELGPTGKRGGARSVMPMLLCISSPTWLFSEVKQIPFDMRTRVAPALVIEGDVGFIYNVMQVFDKLDGGAKLFPSAPAAKPSSGTEAFENTNAADRAFFAVSGGPKKLYLLPMKENGLELPTSTSKRWEHIIRTIFSRGFPIRLADLQMPNAEVHQALSKAVPSSLVDLSERAISELKRMGRLPENYPPLVLEVRIVNDKFGNADDEAKPSALLIHVSKDDDKRYAKSEPLLGRCRVLRSGEGAGTDVVIDWKGQSVKGPDTAFGPLETFSLGSFQLPFWRVIAHEIGHAYQNAQGIHFLGGDNECDPAKSFKYNDKSKPPQHTRDRSWNKPGLEAYLQFAGINDPPTASFPTARVKPSDFPGLLELHNVLVNENAIAAEVGATANETMPRIRYTDFLKKR